ncbi:MAG: hypothetical protein EXR12_05850 [Rhodospirillaceae bacterium]|nr:hypothetical protein [Rhodospirillaceae bacterium]
MTAFDEATSAFLENEKLEQTRDYLHRGRGFAGLKVGKLEEAWVQSFRDFAADIGDDEDLVRMFDLEAEYRLRGLRLPEELVVAEQEALDRGMADWLAEDPDSWDHMADQMMDEIAVFTVDTAAAWKS